MKYKYIMTAILLNISNEGITPKSRKAAKADNDFACLDIEHDDVIVDDISACEVVQVNERILAVTYYVGRVRSARTQAHRRAQGRHRHELPGR